MESDFSPANGAPKDVPSKDAPLLLYDIAFAPPYTENACAPNPWKARYALNFKGAPYTTHWVQMHEIGKVRRGLGVPAGRKFADGTEFYTLPMLAGPGIPTPIGDSFDIAAYLETTFPGAGAGDLFPKQELPYTCPIKMEVLVPLSERPKGPHDAYERFNTEVDAAFSLHAQLMGQGMVWDPKYEADIKAEFVRRIGAESWEAMGIYGEPRRKMIDSLRDTVKELAEMFQKDASGPFILGDRPSHADIIVGGWLRMMSRTLPGEEWREVEQWHDGVFGRLHTALQGRFGAVQ
jgi:glutathione S-transferase